MWKSFVDWLTYNVFGLSSQSHLGGAVNFWINALDVGNVPKYVAAW